jgi:hypothetical protein
MPDYSIEQGLLQFGEGSLTFLEPRFWTAPPRTEGRWITSGWKTIREVRVPVSALRTSATLGPAGRWGWCDRSADFTALVIRSAKREGRIRSAERTEVHLIATIRFHELTFCP